VTELLRLLMSGLIAVSFGTVQSGWHLVNGTATSMDRRLFVAGVFVLLVSFPMLIVEIRRNMARTRSKDCD